MRGFVLFVITGVMLAAPALALAEVRIAVVNVQRVLREAPQAQALRQELQAEMSSRETQLAAKQRELETAVEAFRKDAAAMSESSRQAREQELAAQQRDMIGSAQRFEGEIQQRRTEGLRQIEQQVGGVITNIAERNKYDLVLTEGVAYANDKLDITEQVIKALK